MRDRAETGMQIVGYLYHADGGDVTGQYPVEPVYGLLALERLAVPVEMNRHAPSVYSRVGTPSSIYHYVLSQE